MSEQVNGSGSSNPVPGAIPTAIAGGVGALACFLPWYHCQVAPFGSAIGQAFSNVFEGFAQGAGVDVGSVGGGVANPLGGLTVTGSVSVMGLDMWTGKFALLALMVGAVMHLFESAQGSEKTRSNLLVGSVILSAIGSGCAVYGLSQIGGPVGVHVGLVATLLAGIGAVVLSVRRLQAFGAWRQSSLLVG